jgi:hypothetical protein
VALQMEQQLNWDRKSSKTSLTSRKVRSIFNPTKLNALLAAVLIAVGFSQTGCVTATQKLEARQTEGPYSRVFYANYEDVEVALRQSMNRYPQKVDNTEAGIFETDFIKGEARFKPPHKIVNYPPGYRYRLLVRLVRGRTDERPAIKVQITKKVEVVRDFFSDADSLKTDGLEEQVILYRIGRELQLARAVAKASDKANKKSAAPEAQ